MVNISPEDAKEDDTVKYCWIDEYLMAKRGVTKDLQAFTYKGFHTFSNEL